MSEQEPKPSPSIGIRLAWWFGIYLAGAISYSVFDLAYGWDHGMPFVRTVLFFPGGLEVFLEPLIDRMPDWTAAFQSWLLWLAGPAFYILLLSTTLRTTTRLRFYLVLLVLIATVLLNQYALASSRLIY